MRGANLHEEEEREKDSNYEKDHALGGFAGGKKPLEVRKYYRGGKKEMLGPGKYYQEIQKK